MLCTTYVFRQCMFGGYDNEKVNEWILVIEAFVLRVFLYNLISSSPLLPLSGCLCIKSTHYCFSVYAFYDSLKWFCPFIPLLAYSLSSLIDYTFQEGWDVIWLHLCSLVPSSVSATVSARNMFWYMDMGIISQTVSLLLVGNHTIQHASLTVSTWNVTNLERHML